MKKLIPAIILAIAVSFMLCIYEPIAMYATNINDFWFDLQLMIKPLMLAFLCMIIGTFAVYTIVFFINKAFSKELKVYKVLILIGVILFVALYIQGNFLIKGLPPLDGTSIEWQNYKTQGVISIILYLVISIIVIITTYKLKYDKAIKIYSFVIIAITIMLLASLLSLIVKPGVLDEKDKIVVSSTKHLNEASTNKNFFIFMIDAVDSQMLKEVLDESDKYKDTFDDFTFYPDTMSAYPFTRDSIPFIFSGMWNENEKSFKEYSNDAFNNSELIDELKKQDYEINLYSSDMSWTGKKTMETANLVSMEKDIHGFVFIRQVAKYVMFKYLPYPLKPLSKIETMDFARAQNNEEVEAYPISNIYMHLNLTNREMEKIDKNYFNFTHIEGGHTPFNYDEDVNFIEGGTYQQKLLATLNIVNSFITRLKENGVYDNSVIMVMSDHGFNFGNYIGRQNPALFIKGINEHHDMEISDIPVSYVDLNEAYKQLLDGQPSRELFKNIDVNRNRRYLLYEYTKEDHMLEYEQTGKAWDEETLLPTGKEYNR